MVETVRQALRVLRRRPSYAIAAIGTVALGVGVNAAVFQVLHDVLLRPLAIERPERVVMLWETDPSDDSYREAASLPDYDDFRRSSNSFSAIAGYQRLNVTLSGPDEAPERLRVIAASSGLLELFGRSPVAGRGLSAGDDVAGAEGVALLGEALARRRYGTIDAALEREINFDGRPYRVVGVLPDDLELPAGDAWVALEPHATKFRDQRGVHSTRVVGRLTPGVELRSAQAEMDALAAQLAETYPDENAGRGVFLEPIEAALVGDSSRSVGLLAAAALLVLLVTCTNLAGLALAQLSARGSEIALRASLGARGSSIFRQLAVEATIVAGVGATIGALASGPALRALLALSPDALPRTVDTDPSPWLLAVSLAAALIVALSVSATAGLASTRVAPARLLVARGSEGRGGLQLRRALVALQIALAVALASSASLLVASFERLSSQPAGVDVDRLAVAEATLPAWRYPSPSRDVYPSWPEATSLYDRLLEELVRIPGVTSAALALNHPLERGWTSTVEIDDRETPAADQQESRVRPVTSGYFGTVGLPLVAGRDLAPSDRPGSPAVVVVNRAFVRRHLAGTDPLAHSIRLWGSKKRIVGVVEDERFLGLDRDSEPAIYPSFHQLPMSDLALVVRSDRPSAELGRAMESALRAVDPEIAPYGVRTLRDALDATLAAPRLRTSLFALFGALAVALAAVGLYGVVAADVERRRKELGVRAALGARGSSLVGTILRRALGTGVVGAAFGLVAAVASGRALAALLYRTSPLDPAVLGAATAGALALALGAAVIPALRASRVDPVDALRAE